MDRHSHFTSIFATLALATAGVAQTTVTINFSVNGTSRNAVVRVPNGATKPPVVFFIHGYGGSGSGFQSDTKGNTVSDTAKFVAVYPSAIGGSWSMQDTADYPFLLRLLDTVDARYKIDRNRVYCTGFSQGGFISFGVGYKHPETFAAVAPVSGHIPSFSTSAPLKRAVPLFMSFGTKDVGTNDVADVSSFIADITTWSKLDSCNMASKKEVRPYPSTNTKSVVARITYTCAQGAELMIDSIVGGPHEWTMDATTKVNTTVEVWNFLKRFSLSGTTAIQPAIPPSYPPTLSATYQNGRVHLNGLESPRTVRINDLKGDAIATATAIDGSFEFHQPSGTYLITTLGEPGQSAIKLTIP
jgi:poly(3-hydroxybutyrate) depolymerase